MGSSLSTFSALFRSSILHICLRRSFATAPHNMAVKASILRIARIGYRCSACRAQGRRRYATAVSNDYVNVIEVGPRDGLQNEKNAIPLSTKLDLIHRLAETGIRTIEAGSFVSPKWTPQVRVNLAAREILGAKMRADGQFIRDPFEYTQQTTRRT